MPPGLHYVKSFGTSEREIEKNPLESLDRCGPETWRDPMVEEE